MSLGQILTMCESGDFSPLKSKINYFHINGEETLLKYCCRKGLVKSVKELLTYKDIDLNVKKKTGQSPLIASIHNQKHEVLKLLVAQPKLNIHNDKCVNLTPLDYAILNDDIISVKLLLLRDCTNYKMTVTREEIREILDMYDEDPMMTKYIIAKELDVWPMNIKSDIYTFIVLTSDNYFHIRNKSNKMVRFMKITTRLPLELQMMICQRVVGSAKTIIRSVEIKYGLRSIMRNYK